MNGAKKQLAEIKNINIIKQEATNQQHFQCGKSVLCFETFVDLVVDLARSSNNLQCTTAVAKTWISYFIDCIQLHVSRETPASKGRGDISFKLNRGNISSVVIQKSFDLMNLLLEASATQDSVNEANWDALFVSKSMDSLDAIFFLKYFCIKSPLTNYMDEIALDTDKDRVVQSRFARILK